MPDGLQLHIRDMQCLPTSIHQEIEEHTENHSSMPIDQAHEQVKGSGGAVGLTENPSAFRKWVIAEPEQARLIKKAFAHTQKQQH